MAVLLRYGISSQMTPILLHKVAIVCNQMSIAVDYPDLYIEIEYCKPEGAKLRNFLLKLWICLTFLGGTHPYFQFSNHHCYLSKDLLTETNLKNEN